MVEQLKSADYWAEVEAIAAEVLKANDQGDALHLAVDSHEFIIYPHRARSVLYYSRNEDACIQETGDDAFHGAQSMAEVYTRAAYFAMCEDVREAMARLESEVEEAEEA